MTTAVVERRGHEVPRIFTPPLRPLTKKTSHGFAAIAFAEMVLGLRLFPWQKWLLIHALELRPDGTYRFRTVVVLVARQNGKTLVMLVLALWHLYALMSRTVIGTAQDLANAEKAWEEAVEMAKAEPELADLIDDIKLGHPKRFIVEPDEDVKTEYRVASATRKGGRGFSGDLVLLDELREHQSWDSWSAATKTTLARPKSQVWAFSNAGDALSIVLRYLRASAHQALDWPDGDDDKDILEASAADFEEWEDELGDDEDFEDALGLFEWSARPDRKRHDRDGWAEANPSMNHTDVVADCITARAIGAALRTDPPQVFDVEVLCRWTLGAGTGPFPRGMWVATRDAEATMAKGGRRVVAVDVNWERSRSYIARTGRADDGTPVADVAADRPGTDWVIPWLVEHRERYDSIVVQGNGAPATSLIKAMTKKGLPVVEWGGEDLGTAFGLVFDALEASSDESPRFLHLPHPGLDAAAVTARTRQLSNGAIVIDRVKSPTETSALIAVIAALWGLEQDAPPAKSAYEDNDLMVV